MKKSAFACLLAVSATTLPALADVHEGIGVNAIDRSIGAMTKAGTVAYFKSFDIAVTNATDAPVDLSSLCFTAQTIDGNVFNLDTVDEALTTGSLEAGASASGFASFASNSIEVRFATSVHVSGDC